MKRLIIIPILLVTVIFTSCLYNERVVGSRKTVTYEENIDNFTELDFSNAIEAEVEYGDEYKIVVNINDNLKEYVEIYKRGNKLFCGMKSNISYIKMNLELHITMPTLSSLDASGASKIKLSGFKTDSDLSIDLSGATELDGFVNVENLYLEVSGASEIDFIGSARKLKIDGSGASEIDFSDFKVWVAEIEMSGASELDLNVQNSLSVDLSGASEVKYYGNPKMKHISTSGASEIKSMD